MLRLWLQNVLFSVGWNESIFKLLEKKTQCKSTSEKLCGIVFYALSIRSGIHYCTMTDKVHGCENLGKYGQSSRPVQFAMVFMAKGLCSKWKQTLRYFLFEKSVPADTIKMMVIDCIKKLKETGLYPKFVTCDHDPSNVSAFKKMGITDDNPYLMENEEKVFFFYDAPHLLKSIRNNLFKYDFKVGNEKISWQYIKKFYEIDRNMCIRRAPKVSDIHIHPNSFQKMRVQYARQIFCRTVAAAIHTHATLGVLPTEAAATAKLIYKMDELFDIFNSSQRKHYRKSKCAISNDIDFQQLTDKGEWIKQWTIEGCRQRIPSVAGWLLNIQSLKLLWKDIQIKFKIDYLLTRKLNQDC